MKIRTVYFKAPTMNTAREFWQSFLKKDPHKSSDFWTEFNLGTINFAILRMDDFRVDENKSNFVPVFEYSEADFNSAVARARDLKASVIVDIEDHPDKLSYVFADPFGNEFEITKFRD